MLVDDLRELPERPAAFIAALADGQAQLTLAVTALATTVSAVSTVVGLPQVEGTHECPGCRRMLVPRPDGSWPPHDIAAAPAGRRGGPRCRRSGLQVEQTTVAVA